METYQRLPPTSFYHGSPISFVSWSSVRSSKHSRGKFLSIISFQLDYFYLKWQYFTLEKLPACISLSFPSFYFFFFLKFFLFIFFFLTFVKIKDLVLSCFQVSMGIFRIEWIKKTQRMKTKWRPAGKITRLLFINNINQEKLHSANEQPIFILINALGPRGRNWTSISSFETGATFNCCRSVQIWRQFPSRSQFDSRNRISKRLTTTQHREGTTMQTKRLLETNEKKSK